MLVDIQKADDNIRIKNELLVLFTHLCTPFTDMKLEYWNLLELTKAYVKDDFQDY